MRILPTILLGTLTLLASGCYTAPVVPPRGILFSQVTHPLTTDYRDTPVGPDDTIHVSEEINYFIIPVFGVYTFAFGEAEVEEIARRNQIQEISYAELTYLNVLGIFQQSEVHVYGR